MPLRFGRNYSAVSDELFAAIAAYIDQVYAGAPADALHDPNRARFSRPSAPFDATEPMDYPQESVRYAPMPEAVEEDDFCLERSSGPMEASFAPMPEPSQDADFDLELSPGPMDDNFAPTEPAVPTRKDAPAAQPKAAREAGIGASPDERTRGAAALREEHVHGMEALRRQRARREDAAPRRAKSSRGFAGLFRRPEAPAPSASLEDMLSQIDESFGQTLLRRIDERRLTDAQCYKRANVDRRLFNKIKNNPDYRPGKQTVLAFAIALRLTLEETRDLLMKAGYALSHSSKSDIVVEYCILNGIYDIIEINQVLFRLDLQPLGY